MDVLAHGLWTNLAFAKKYKEDKKNRLWAVFFGLIPDFATFTPVFVYMIFTGSRFGIESFRSSEWVFRYAANAYNYTHSLVIFALVAILVFALRKGKMYWPMWGWALHIVIDIPSHSGFYETPFLFPLSNFKVSGISWGNPVFMMVNYSALVICYFLLYIFQKKRKKISN